MPKAFKRSKTIFRPASTEVFNTVVRTYVTNYCSDFSFQKKALGLLRSRNYKGLLDLGEAVEEELIFAGHGDSSHTEYCGHDKYARASQFAALITKYQYSAQEIPGLDPITAAIDDFLSAERRNKRINSIFRAHRLRGTERHWSVKSVRDVFCRVLGRTPPFEDVFDNCDYSGGATTDLSGESTHMGRKLTAESLQGTEYAFDLFKHAVSRNHHYSSVLLQELDDQPSTASCIPANSFQSRERLWQLADEKFVEACCDQIKVVPKKAKRGRTIGKPTPVNNFVQKGIDKVMRDRLRKTLNLDLSDQSENGLMAYEGSLNHETFDPYVTIDVRGASNSVCLEPIRTVVPPRWFNLLEQTRSTHYSITEEGYGDKPEFQNQRYEMFVSMGNGFCFPLETLLFAAICIAAYRHTGSPCDFRVYGDDIIVRQSHALVVKEILNQFGFRINNDKTCWFGPFRESCGANWYGGRNVVPSYLKERVSTLSKLVSLHNGLHKYREVQEALRNLVPVMERPLVPDTKAWSWITDQAFVVPEDIAIGLGRSHWDPETQSFAFPILVTYPVSDDRFWSESKLKRRTQSSLRLAAGLRGSTFEEPFHLRRTVIQRFVDYHEKASAETRRSLKRRRSIEDFVGPHRYVIA